MSHNLSDDDIKAIVNALEDKMVERLKINVGTGVLGLVWRGIIILVIVLAAYGSVKGIKIL